MGLTTFHELRRKEVINVCTGERMGHVCDIEFETEECRSSITAVIVPGPSRFFGIVRSDEELVIPYRCIQKIGRDVILVEIEPKKPHLP